MEMPDRPKCPTCEFPMIHLPRPLVRSRWPIRAADLVEFVTRLVANGTVEARQRWNVFLQSAFEIGATMPVMPALVLWAVLAVIVLGGGTYWLVHLH